MALVVPDADSVLEEINRVLRRLEGPDAHHGAGLLAVTLRAMADAQARLLRSFDFRIQGQDTAIAELRQQNAGENARRNARLVELTEILAGHGVVLVELQQYRRDGPTRRRSLLTELESRFQRQEAGVMELAQRVENSEVMVGELRKHAAEMVSEVQQVRTSDGETRMRITRCKDEILDLWRLHEEVANQQGSAVAAVQEQQQRHSACLSELQRWCVGHQRARAQRLEAELKSPSRATSPTAANRTTSPTGSPLSSTALRGSLSASPLSSSAARRSSLSPSPNSWCPTTPVGGQRFPRSGGDCEGWQV